MGNRRRSALAALVLAAGLAVPAAGLAADADAVLGIWDTAIKDAKVEVVRCGDRYCGDVIWLREPEYPAGSRDDVPGTAVLDRNNPDPKLRRQPLLGLRVMRNFAYAGGSWTGGTIYDPKDGKTYRGTITLVSPDRLNLRGYVGIPLFGRTSHWTRGSL